MHSLKYFAVFFMCVLLIPNSDCQDKTESYDAVVDAVYVINLDRSPERLQKISKQLDDMGIKFRRFRAIDGRKLKIINVKTDKIEDIKSFTSHKKIKYNGGRFENEKFVVSCENFSINYETEFSFLGAYLSYGELGCAMSHLAVMHDIVKNNFKKAILLEDDVVFEKNFKNDLKLMLANTPDDFDIVFLDVGMNGLQTDFELSHNELQYIANPERLLAHFNKNSNNKYCIAISENNCLFGTHAYCVSLKGAQKIILNTDPLTAPIDDYIFRHPKMNNSQIKRYVARKKMLYISDDRSIIDKMGRNQQHISKNDRYYQKPSIFILYAIIKKAFHICTKLASDFYKKIANAPYDAIYVINLDRTPERFENTKKQLNEFDLNPTRFSAVDGFDVTLTNKRTGEIISGKQTMQNIKKYTNIKSELYHVEYKGKYKDAEFELSTNNSSFSAGEIGITFSHRAIWADIVKNKYKKVIVFEDDAIPLKNFRENLFDLLQNIPQDSDITFISVGIRKDKSYYFPDIDKIFRDFDNVPNNKFVAKIQPTNRVYGMFAYIVGENGAKKLLNITNKVNYPLDDIVFQQDGINNGKIKGYTSRKKICSVSFSDSEIKKMGRAY